MRGFKQHSDSLIWTAHLAMGSIHTISRSLQTASRWLNIIDAYASGWFNMDKDSIQVAQCRSGWFRMDQHGSRQLRMAGIQTIL